MKLERLPTVEGLLSIFFYFSKAFDRVQHNILINKLKNMGFLWALLD